MLLSRLRHNEHIQIRRRLSRPRIFPACPPNFVRCEGRRSPAVEVTGDLSGWQQTGEITYFTTPTLDFSPPPPPVPSPCVSLAPVLTGFLISYVFSTCMPHYILKVNPINTEITLEDKLLRRGSFCVCVCVA